MPLDLPTIRSKFLALRHTVIFLDDPGGTQVAQPILIISTGEGSL